jgi:hypothetical protein
MPVVARSVSTRSRCRTRDAAGRQNGNIDEIDEMQFVAVVAVSGSHAMGALLSSVLTQGGLFVAALVATSHRVSSTTTVARGGVSPLSFARLAVVAQLVYAASVCYFGPNVAALAVLTIRRRSTDSATVSRGVLAGCIVMLAAQLSFFVCMLVALRAYRGHRTAAC